METEDRISQFKNLLEENFKSKIMENIRQGKKRVTINFSDIASYDSDLGNDIIDDAEESIRAANIALESITDQLGFKIRIRGDVPANKVRIRDLRAKDLNKFITIEGSIETKTDVGIRLTSSKFECPNCDKIINVLQFSDELKEPSRCSCGRKGKFRLLVGESELMDIFTMRLQELSSSVKYGSSMKMISVICSSDLTDTIIEEKLIEGTKIKINGIYKEKWLVKGGKKQTQLVTYFDANYIQISEETYYDIELNPEDIEEIKEYSKRPDILKVISEDLFKGVYGNYPIKEALTLQAFGGVSDYEATPKIRGDMHILLVGDAGQNKSVFLEYVSKFSPKNVLCVGKTVSAVGMSGATIKDELTGSFVLKPGAIPLANNGLILIDELDKMKVDDRDILHEPMEAQIISISKANLADRKMLARESFLVSMNPKNGYFNDFDELYEQIDLPPTLINRFCLVYILKKDRLKTEESRNREMEKARLMMTRNNEATQRELSNFHKFIRKYIAYARQYVNPVFDNYLANEYIPEKYAQIDHERKRNNPEEKVGFPISPRHLFIIKRIAEAKRRILLGDKVTVEDVDFAIDKLRESLEQFATSAETGRIDVDYITDGVSSKSKKLIEVFDDIFDKLEQGELVSVDELYAELTNLGHKDRDVDQFLEKKKKHGDIIEPRRGYYKRLK